MQSLSPRRRWRSELVRCRFGSGGHRPRSQCRCRLFLTSNTAHSILVSFELHDAGDYGRTNVPCWGTVERLGSVVVAFTVPAHIENFVLDISTALAVQAEDLVFEALPLGFLVFGVVLCVCVVCLADETKVCSCLQVLSGFIAPSRGCLRHT